MFEENRDLGEAGEPEREQQAREEADSGGVVAVRDDGESSEMLTAEGLADVAKPGEAESQEQKYATFESFSAEAIAVIGSGRAVVEQIKAGRELTPELNDKIKQHIATINELFKTKFSQLDTTGLYPELLILKVDLTQIKVDKLVSSLSGIGEATDQDLSGVAQDTAQKIQELSAKLALLSGRNAETQKKIQRIIEQRLQGQSLEGVADSLDEDHEGEENPDLVDLELSQLEDSSENPEDIQKLKTLRKVMKLAGYAGAILGETADIFFDKNDVDLAAFLRFVWNPTGLLAAGTDYRRSGENGEEVPYHVFKEKFRNYKDVGIAFSVAANSLAGQSAVFKSWRDSHDTELKQIKESPNSVKTHELFMSLHKEVLADNVSGSAANWNLFSKSLASAMFGGEVSMDSDSVEFLKEQFKNEGTKLKAFWNIGETGSSDTKSENKEEKTDFVQPTESLTPPSEPSGDAS